MKVVEGWRRIDNKRGYLNVTTGQSLAVTKRQYGEHYLVLLYPEMRNDEEGREISPEYATESKAEAFALDWMSRHPKGAEETLNAS